MLKTFICDEHDGFICVHFIDTNKFTRWGVSRSWTAGGEALLESLRADLDYVTCAAEGVTPGEALLSVLAHLVAEAALEGLHDELPFRSAALMALCGPSCLLIEARQADGAATSVCGLDVDSVEEADRLIDEREARTGAGHVRYGRDCTGATFSLIPVPDTGVLPTGVELSNGLPAALADALAERLDNPELRARLIAALANSSSRGGAFRVH